MYCPFCGAADTKVIDSRLADDGSQVRRRRECIGCHERFTTYESHLLELPRVVKRDGTRESFDQEKIKAGMLTALDKRAVSVTEIDRALRRIFNKVKAAGDREITAKTLGELVMAELKDLDAVAYVRFASIYKRFEDIEAFSLEIKQLTEDVNE